MAEKPFTPPTRKPVSEFPTPDPSVAFYTELVNRDDPAYIENSPVARGQLYANMVGAKREVIAQFPNLFFLRERKFQLSDQLVLWDWATDEQAHNTYNSEVNYIANAVPYPGITRTYTIRRELYESDPTSVIGSPLPGVISVSVTNPGEGYSEANGTIDGTTVAVSFTISATGGLLAGIITRTGDELIQDGTSLIIIGDGVNGTATVSTQPIGCVLVSQKKEELPDADPLSHELVKVTRVYETLPGPWIYATKIDKDGMFVSTKTRRQVADFITDKDEILNGEWIQTWHKDSDDFVAEETIETRPVPGNTIIDTKVAEDGKIITTNKTLVDTTTLISNETLVLGVWTKRFGEEVDDGSLIKVHQASNKVSWQMSEARDVPGNPLVDTRIEKDGMVMIITKILADTTLIVSNEVIAGGFWVTTHKEEVSDLVANQVQEVRAIPGNPMVEIKVDKDGIPRDIVKTLKDTTTIVPSEVISGGGIWVTTEKEPVSDLVANEIVTARLLPGNFVPSATVGSDYEVSNINTRLRAESGFSPSASEDSGFITTVEKKDVTDLVSDEVTTVKRWLDEGFYQISIENLIPREFMATIPTFVESHIYAGNAVMPTLGLGQFEHSQKQLNKLLYEDRVTSLGAISLPITHTNKETTEEYGGGVLNVNLTLDILGAQTIDEGYLVVNSKLTDLGNGMLVKESRVLDGTSWPLLTSSLWDDNMRLQYTETQQVVPFGSSPDINPGVFGWISEIRKLDYVRTTRINTSKPTPAYTDESNALITYEFRPFRFPGLIYFAGAGYYIRSADARLTQVMVKTWWINSASPPPVPTVDEIIVDDPIISSLNDNTQLQYAGPCIHDDLLTFGVLFFPATTPSWTVYTTTWIGNYKIIGASVTPEKEIDVWKYQTQSLIMR